jgi:hypothetical protein
MLLLRFRELGELDQAGLGGLEQGVAFEGWLQGSVHYDGAEGHCLLY